VGIAVLMTLLLMSLYHISLVQQSVVIKYGLYYKISLAA